MTQPEDVRANFERRVIEVGRWRFKVPEAQAEKFMGLSTMNAWVRIGGFLVNTVGGIVIAPEVPGSDSTTVVEMSFADDDSADLIAPGIPGS